MDRFPSTLVTSHLPELYYTMSQDQAVLVTVWLPVIDLLSMGPLSSLLVFVCLSLCPSKCTRGTLYMHYMTVFVSAHKHTHLISLSVLISNRARLLPNSFSVSVQLCTRSRGCSESATQKSFNSILSSMFVCVCVYVLESYSYMHSLTQSALTQKKL